MLKENTLITNEFPKYEILSNLAFATPSFILTSYFKYFSYQQVQNWLWPALVLIKDLFPMIDLVAEPLAPYIMHRNQNNLMQVFLLFPLHQEVPPEEYQTHPSHLYLH